MALIYLLSTNYTLSQIFFCTHETDSDSKKVAGLRVAFEIGRFFFTDSPKGQKHSKRGNLVREKKSKNLKMRHCSKHEANTSKNL